VQPSGSGIRRAGRRYLRFRSIPRPTLTLPFPATGGFFAFAEGGGLRVWDLAAKREIWRNVDPVRTAYSLAFSPDRRTLAAGYDDTTILIWSLPQPDNGKPIPANERTAIWDTLASSDVVAAHASMWRLVDDPATAIPLLRERAPPIYVAPNTILPLVQDLGSADFKTREAAERKLKQLGRAVEKELRAALKDDRGAETKSRLNALLASLEPDSVGARAVTVLERIGTPEARKLLEEIAAGDSRMAREAKAALERK
jgi:hypothetical protein